MLGRPEVVAEPVTADPARPVAELAGTRGLSQWLAAGGLAASAVDCSDHLSDQLGGVAAERPARSHAASAT